MKTIITKIKQNPLYLLLPIAFLSFLLINLNVVYFGDDYGYLRFRDLGFTEYFQRLFEHYQSTNGRFLVHLLVTFFLKLPMIFWQIFNSLMLTGICYFSMKILTTKNSQMKPIIFSIMFFLIASLSILITRESTYWLTGSFNYVYPLFLLLAYMFTLTKIENKTYFISSLILGFLSASTVEQGGMMAFGLTLLVFLSNFSGFKNLKTQFLKNQKLLLLTIITLVGVCTVILSPSQFSRINSELTQENQLPLVDQMVENIKFLSSHYTTAENILPFCVVFNTFTIIYLLQNDSKKEKKILISLSALNLLLTVFNIYIVVKFNLSNFIKYPITAFILLSYGILCLHLNKKMYHSLLNPLTIAITLLVGSQGMMIISPIFGYRNSIFGIIMFAFIISLIASKTNLKYINYIVTGLFTLGLIFNFRTALGYRQTKLIEEKNIGIITTNQEYLSDPSYTLMLYKFPNPNYAWSMPYISPWHNERFKEFYQIECTLFWK